eukprot:CAMPEP_0197188698 /NCGR_PEP_ID=MMETSP1423-20130617/18309_1 /TAXON_ID=476441 /ORGANISM="Pseudo-nitzschia heimii, Strain UNC1101" /LENGTH=366 /DNA_ID=CAMNT_0042640605 /DNA_START=22 /DNA_END=1122 /DNA_ORIENTATION=+
MTNDSAAKNASILLVGCGAPLKSMGAYHAIQILDNRVPDAELQYIVEPWYFSEASKSKPGYDEFHTWRKQLEADRGIGFFPTVAEVPAPKEGELRLAVISARTADNPDLLADCVANGCDAVYLEKPGATTVKDLEAMRDLAASKKVAVHMGFNKNVSSYLTKTREFANEHGSRADVTFLHNNNYPNTTEALSECFERNAEGMLKNMAIHELAICVTYYGVTVDTIASVQVDKEYSSVRTLGNFTDFDKLKFKLTTKSGVSISVAADRCGGDDSVGIVTDAASGAELARFSMPDDDTIAKIPTLQEKYGDAMPYFFTQDPDYLELKNRVVRSVVHGKDPEGVADITVAIETLKVAEYLTPILQEQLQ